MFGLPFEILLVYLLGVLGLSKNLRHGVIEKIGNTTNLLDTVGNILKEDFLGNIFPRASAKVIDPKTLQTSFTDTFSGTFTFFSDIVKYLRDHASDVAKRLEPDDSLRTWRIFGYLFQLLFLVAFAYADLVQLINNFAILFPQNIVQNPVLNNLNLSLLITSVGTAVTAGFIIGEFAQVTKFGKWHEIQPPWRNNLFQLLTWFALIATLAIDFIVALARVTTIETIAPLLSQETIAQLKLAAAFASSAVIVPLFILTFLFLGGIVGVAIIYIIIVWLISLVVQIVQLLFVGIIWILVFSISYIVELIFRVILWVITVILFVFGWVFAGAGATLIKLLEVIKSLTDIIYFPLDALVDWAVSYLEHRRKTPIKPTG